MADEEKYLQAAELSEEENALVATYANAIDLTDTSTILTYGAEAQKKIAAFSDTALEGVKTKDLGGVSNLITGLVTELKGFDVSEEKKGLFSFLRKKSNKLMELTTKFDSAENNVNKVVSALEAHQDTLTKDVVMMDEMYAANLDYFKDLSMYVIAGKIGRAHV